MLTDIIHSRIMVASNDFSLRKLKLPVEMSWRFIVGVYPSKQLRFAVSECRYTQSSLVGRLRKNNSNLNRYLNGAFFLPAQYRRLDP